ncbi:MAG: hypothetical protein PVH24_01240 [Candidatus Zixiibacteriota bacterium]|jgi:hypothetical protein
MESGGKNKGILGGDFVVAHPEGGAPRVGVWSCFDFAQHDGQGNLDSSVRWNDE